MGSGAVLRSPFDRLKVATFEGICMSIWQVDWKNGRELSKNTLQQNRKLDLDREGTALQPKQHIPPAPWEGKRAEPKCFDRSWALNIQVRLAPYTDAGL